MAANAAYLVDIEVSADDTTYTPVGGANNCSQNLTRALLEVTEYGDEAIKRIPGLKDAPVTISGHRDHADAGQAILVAAWINGTSVWVRRLHNGVNGFKIECHVGSFNGAGGVSETATFDAQMSSTGSPVVV
jgi:hypothetical protein